MTQNIPLTRREYEVVGLLLQGKSNKLIALGLGISDRTVEFHLKNIYAKFAVGSRVELILKLGNATGLAEAGQPGISTVAKQLESGENRDEPSPHTGRIPNFSAAVASLGKELQMKYIFNTLHVPVGVLTTLFTGFAWLALLQRFGHASPDSIRPWLLPLGVTMILIGTALGLIGKRNGSRSGKVLISSLLGSGLGSILMLPLTVAVIYPLGKLAEALGLVNRAAISTGTTSTLLYAAMLGIWLITGIAAGTLLLHLSLHRSRTVDVHRQVSQPGL
jgi:DNA-binding CsgD family transcriptional regulator